MPVVQVSCQAILDVEMHAGRRKSCQPQQRIDSQIWTFFNTMHHKRLRRYYVIFLWRRRRIQRIMFRLNWTVASFESVFARTESHGT